MLQWVSMSLWENLSLPKPEGSTQKCAMDSEGTGNHVTAEMMRCPEVL